MSGIAAIIYFDGQNVQPGVIKQMTTAMRHRGPDGISHWEKDSVAFGHCMLHTTTESLEEVQPLCSEDESLALVIDGWLSNWEDLRRELLAKGATLRTRSDAELVLRAYQTWGANCLEHIDGEFAFVIWDARRGEVFAANDHIGLKMLHYHWNGRRLIIASDIAGILAHPSIKREPNHSRIAEYLTFDFASRGETVWKGVMRALPARSMRFRHGSFESSKYWEPPFEVSITYKRDEEYFEHYREVFADCVRRSSRSHFPLACDVSGGLDSSAVFAMAHDLSRRGQLCAPDIKGYTYHFVDAAGTEHDEIEYARAVAKHVGVEVKEITPFMPDLSWFAERGRADCDIAGYPNGAMSTAIGQALVGDGCRVILNGEGGDEWLGGNPFYFAEQIAARDWRALASSFREDATDIGWSRSTYNLLRFGLRPQLPKWLSEGRRRLKRSFKSNHWGAEADWLSEELKASLSGMSPIRSRDDFLRISNMARRSMYMVMTDPFALVVWDQFSRQSSRIGYEIRTPMYARKFIEFAFSTPERIRLRGDTRKYVHIKALEGLLPEVVAKRKTKADFMVAFRRILGDAETALTISQNGGGSGFLNQNGIAKLFDRHRDNPTDGILIWHLWTIYEIEELFR